MDLFGYHGGKYSGSSLAEILTGIFVQAVQSDGALSIPDASVGSGVFWRDTAAFDSGDLCRHSKEKGDGRMGTVIKVENVSKCFGDAQVLKDVSMELETGKIYGLVGRNGSGKTMLIKCICGFVHPTKGRITVHGQVIGKDVEFAQDVGFIIEKPGFLPQFDAFKNLAYLYSVNQRTDKKRIEDCIRLVGLDPSDRKKTGKFSMGMKQRLGIAQAIMESPSVILVDEPFNGLDYSGVEEIRKLFLDMKEEGKTILLVSHNREDISTLCDEVFEMDQGVLVKKRE